jgi:hypothetical protein
MRRGRATDISTPVAITAPVDRKRRLAEGGLVQATVRARLLGIPLLRLDATVALVPAAYSVTSPALASGNGLVEAVQRINEGAEVLAQVRRNGRH